MKMEASIIKFITDPNVFNYTILALYVLNAMRWGWERNLGQSIYWLCAFGITASVTFLMESK